MTRGTAAVLLLAGLAVLALGSGTARAQDQTDRAIQAGIDRAAKARDAGRGDDARREVMAAASVAGDNPRYLRSLAAGLLDHGFPELASQVCTQTLAKNPDDPILHGVLGMAYSKMRRYVDALAELTIATSKQPNRKEWWVALGRAHLQANQEAAALAAIDRARALAGDDVEVLEVKAECEYRNMRMQQCEETCRLLLSKSPNNAMGWQLLIRVLRTQGRIDAARAAAEDAIKAIGRHPEIVLERGLVLLAQNKTEDAVTDLKDVTARLPNDPRAYMHLCKAYTRLGMTKEAKAAKARYLELSPDVKVSESRKN